MSSIAKARLLSNKVCMNILIGECNLFLTVGFGSNRGTLDGVRLMLEGQAADLHSTYVAECPQEHEYLQMVDRSTIAKPIIIIMVADN